MAKSAVCLLDRIDADFQQSPGHVSVISAMCLVKECPPIKWSELGPQDLRQSQVNRLLSQCLRRCRACGPRQRWPTISFTHCILVHLIVMFLNFEISDQMVAKGLLNAPRSWAGLVRSANPSIALLQRAINQYATTF